MGVLSNISKLREDRDYKRGYVFIEGRYVRVWGLKRPQKTSNVSIFETVVRLN